MVVAFPAATITIGIIQPETPQWLPLVLRLNPYFWLSLCGSLRFVPPPLFLIPCLCSGHSTLPMPSVMLSDCPSAPHPLSKVPSLALTWGFRSPGTALGFICSSQANPSLFWYFWNQLHGTQKEVPATESPTVPCTQRSALSSVNSGCGLPQCIPFHPPPSHLASLCHFSILGWFSFSSLQTPSDLFRRWHSLWFVFSPCRLCLFYSPTPPTSFP